MIPSALFYLFAAIAVIAALNVVFERRLFYAAISLIICLCSISGIYMLLESQFIAAVQVIVYAGAIMVLFLFVIMLLDPFSTAAMKDKKRFLAYGAAALGIMAFVLLLPLISSYDAGRVPREAVALAGAPVTIRKLGETLFREFLLPFEVTSVLVLAAIVGAVVLAKKRP